MTVGKAIDTLSKEEFDLWFKRKMRRLELISRIIVVIVLAVSALSVTFCIVEAVECFLGDDAWPTGLFLSVLILWGISVLWRYSSQQEEDRRRQQYEEAGRTEYYS